jgi:hypothetical protein
VPTARSLITDSLMAIGQYGSNQTPTPEDAQLGVRTLQRLLDSWSNDNLQIWTTADATVTTTSGDADYSTSEWSNTRVPVTIQNIWLRNSPIDVPLSSMTEQEYNEIPDKAIQGTPREYMWKRVVHDYSGDNPVDDVTADDLRGTLYLYPTPDAAYPLHIMGRLTLVQTLTLDSWLVFPPGVALCKFFGIDPKPDLVHSAGVAKAALEAANFVPSRLDTGLPVMGERYFRITERL